MKIRVGGVPEHFNMPWHLALENNLFKSKGLDVEWITYKGGTGAMCKALRNNEVDICVILTEGITKDILDGNKSKIISNYINTPLIWGVHTAAHSELNHYAETFTKNYAVSRLGSGSHLMPQVDAMIKGYEIEKEQFIPVKNLEGALQSLEKGDTQVFYWEKYTTKPYVDSGKLRCLGEFVTPWPCFVLAATDLVIENHKEALKKLVDTIHFTADQFVKIPDVTNQLAQRYHQKTEDIENWFHSTEWALRSEVSEKMLLNVVHSLKKTGLIENDQKFKLNDVIQEL